MIPIASIALAAYEAYSCLFGKPKVTDLSHRRPWAFLVWSWYVILGLHFIHTAQRASRSR